MNASQLLNQLLVEGFTVKLQGESLEISGGKLNDEQRQAIRENKHDLVGLLKPAADSYDAADREAIRREHEAIEADTDFSFPSFEGIKQGVVPEGWTLSKWLPASTAAAESKTPYFDKLRADMLRQNPAAFDAIARCKGDCKCGSEEAYLQVIRGGEAIRRDCARCGSFIDFPARGSLVEASAGAGDNQQDAERLQPLDASNPNLCNRKAATDG